MDQQGKQGDAGAQADLGVMYGEGRGVPQDNAEAAKWYRLVAVQMVFTRAHGLARNVSADLTTLSAPTRPINLNVLKLTN